MSSAGYYAELHLKTLQSKSPYQKFTPRLYVGEMLVRETFIRFQKIIEKYRRNVLKDADKDVAEVIYNFDERIIDLKFHYSSENITQIHWSFHKGTFAERCSLLNFDPTSIFGYLTGPNVPEPKPVTLFRLEMEYLRKEELAEKKIRERENEVSTRFFFTLKFIINASV